MAFLDPETGEYIRPDRPRVGFGELLVPGSFNPVPGTPVATNPNAGFSPTAVPTTPTTPAPGGGGQVPGSGRPPGLPWSSRPGTGGNQAYDWQDRPGGFGNLFSMLGGSGGGNNSEWLQRLREMLQNQTPIMDGSQSPQAFLARFGLGTGSLPGGGSSTPPSSSAPSGGSSSPASGGFGGGYLGWLSGLLGGR
jgi:hypothetical protein